MCVHLCHVVPGRAVPPRGMGGGGGVTSGAWCVQVHESVGQRANLISQRFHVSSVQKDHVNCLQMRWKSKIKTKSEQTDQPSQP